MTLQGVRQKHGGGLSLILANKQRGKLSEDE